MFNIFNKFNKFNNFKLSHIKIPKLISANFNFAKTILNMLLAYLSIIGIITFSLFIAQEGIQMCSFANFSASDTRQYNLIKQNCEVMDNILIGMNKLNKILVILNPFQYWAYDSYIMATKSYIQTLEAEVLANQPSLYNNQIISFKFNYDSFKPAKNNLYIAQNNKIKVILNKIPSTKPLSITGLVKLDPEKLNSIIIINQ